MKKKKPKKNLGRKKSGKALTPIHKFNNGNGATLCHKCGVMISTGTTDDLYCKEHGGTPEYKYELVRLRDDMCQTANEILYIEWDKETKVGKKLRKRPKIGCSLMMEPILRGVSYKWMTTEITEIVEKKKNYLKFKTLNSTYELHTN